LKKPLEGLKEKEQGKKAYDNSISILSYGEGDILMEKRNPKILYVVQNLSGGVLTYLRNLSGYLRSRYQIALAYAPDADTPEDLRSLFDADIPLYKMTTFEHEGNLIRESIAREELRDIVGKENPDIIHMHGYRAGKIGRKALDGMGIPMFYTPHGYMHLKEPRSILSRSLYRSNEETAARTACMTIACSKGEYEETLTLTENATYVNNGIDTKEIDRVLRDCVSADHPFTVYTAGRINRQKNPDLFNEIADVMSDVRFVWIGGGNYRDHLTAPNIEITGWLSHEQSIRRAMEADVFILPSLWEGMPLSLLEAMYMKKLCIVNDVIGSRDVIHSGENGYVVHSAAGFVNAIHHAKDEKTKQLVARAHQDVAENYTIEKMADEYSRIYQEALAD